MSRRATAVVTIEGHSPGEVRVGERLHLLIHGRAVSEDGPILSVDLAVGGSSARVAFDGIARPDAYEAIDGVSPDRSLFSGFAVEWHGAFEAVGSVDVTLRFHVRTSGKIALTDDVRVGKIEIRPRRVRALPKRPPRVAIAMATFNPDLELLERQILSLQRQTIEDWSLSVSDESDDDRFTSVLRDYASHDPRIRVGHGRRLGFYGNFERALREIDRRAPYFAFADQDDDWYPDKLSHLIEELEAHDVSLVVGDMRVVDRSGRVVAPSFWSWRVRHGGRPNELLVANTVTGAALLGRMELVALALPFPHFTGVFHDSWLALLAARRSGVRLSARVVQDYVQHASNVLGQDHRKDELYSRQFHLEAEAVEGMLKASLKSGSYAGLSDQHVSRMVTIAASVWPAILQRRFLNNASLINVGHTPVNSVVPGGKRSLKAMADRDDEVGGRNYLSIARWLIAGVSLIDLLKKHEALRSVAGRWTAAAAVSVRREVTLEAKIVSPSVVRRKGGSPKRATILVPELDSNRVFGGYLAKLHLAKALADAGMSVRLALVDQVVPNIGELARIEQLDPSLGGLFSSLEVEEWGGRHGPFGLGSRDLVVATTWWTALVADKLGLDRTPLYLIQEYEPLTVPQGSWSVMAERSYEVRHHALFSTAILRNHFKANKIGVFSRGAVEWRPREAWFDPPVVDSTPKTPAQDETRTILCYMRPEPHAARNLYEVLLIALREVAARLPDISSSKWTLRGVGASNSYDVDIGSMRVEVLKREGLEQYKRLLASSQIGVALMHAPHPSMVPLDMAAAGMRVVTTTFGSKTASVLRKLAPNIVGVRPDPHLIAEAVLQAVQQVDRGTVGSAPNLPTQWKFDVDWIQSLA